MPTAYIDPSGLVAIAFNQRQGSEFELRLGAYTRLVSSNFLEAEVRAAFANPERGRQYDSEILSGIEWIYSDRPLSREIESTLSVGYLRGGDLWHVAVALYFYPDPTEVYFLSLDDRQRGVAEALGFQV